MSRRAAIAMSDAEVLAFLDDGRVVTCATLGPDGWPHLMPLWYVVRDGEVWAWTYAKSQKVRNLERDARCTLQIEAGDTYLELRGVMIKCAAAIHREREVVRSVGQELAERYSSDPRPALRDSPTARGPEAHADERQAAKRVALQFIANDVASFDHRKLG